MSRCIFVILLCKLLTLFGFVLDSSPPHPPRYLSVFGDFFDRWKGREMITRRVLAMSLAISMAVSLSPVFAQQAAGTIAGKATDEVKAPFDPYTVQLRDAATSQVVATVPLNPQGMFSFANVEMARRYLIELVQTNPSNKQAKVICTEGPYSLSASLTAKTDVVIDCGKTPAALWLLAAGAGTAAAIAIATRSASR